MKAEITSAAGVNAPESNYPVVESAADLYATTGAVDDFAVSLQFLPDNKEGDNKFALTFEAGDKMATMEGSFPTRAQVSTKKSNVIFTPPSSDFCSKSLLGRLLVLLRWQLGKMKCLAAFGLIEVGTLPQSTHSQPSR
jgi:hypothetical protein